MVRAIGDRAVNRAVDNTTKSSSRKSRAALVGNRQTSVRDLGTARPRANVKKQSNGVAQLRDQIKALGSRSVNMSSSVWSLGLLLGERAGKGAEWDSGRWLD